MALILTFTTACTSLRFRSSDYKMDRKLQAELDKKLGEAEDLLESGQAQRAAELFQDYSEKWTNTVYRSRAQIGLQRAHILSGKSEQAKRGLLQIIEGTSNRHPEITGLASFYLSFSYDELGDDTKTLAALKDAERLSDYLPLDIAKAELPARLAAAYNRVGNQELAARYYRTAEKNVGILFIDRTSKSKARIFYGMGQFQSKQIDQENFHAKLKSFEMIQIFALRSIEAADPHWSSLAAQNLRQNYYDFWNSILAFYVPKTSDRVADQYHLKEKQRVAIQSIIQSIEKLKTFRSSESTEPKLSELIAFLSELQKYGNSVILSMGPTNPLTQEAERRQSLHRGTVYSEPFFPGEKLPPKKQEQ